VDKIIQTSKMTKARAKEIAIGHGLTHEESHRYLQTLTGKETEEELKTLLLQQIALECRQLRKKNAGLTIRVKTLTNKLFKHIEEATEIGKDFHETYQALDELKQDLENESSELALSLGESAQIFASKFLEILNKRVF
jgi:hypothetical protein